MDDVSLRSNASGEVVEPRPVYADPSVGRDSYGENGDQPQDYGAQWALSFGCTVSFGYLDGELRVTREQLSKFASGLRHVVALGGTNEAWWTDDENTYKVRVQDVDTIATIKLEGGETCEVGLSELRHDAGDSLPESSSEARTQEGQP